MFDEIQNPQSDEFEALGLCLQQFIDVHDPEQIESDQMILELKKLGLFDLYPSDYAEQLRTYCEWKCNTFPVGLVQLSERFETTLRTMYREELDTPSPENVLQYMGFVPTNNVRFGVSILTSKLSEHYAKLVSGNEETIPTMSYEQIGGLVGKAFSHTEELLEYIVSYYIQVLAAHVTHNENPFETMKKAPEVLNMSKAEKHIITKWAVNVNGGWEKLISSKSLKIIKWLNKVLSDKNSDVSKIFFTYFENVIQDIQELLIADERLEEIELLFNESRHEYAHERSTEEMKLADYQAASLARVRALVEFAKYIQDRNIVPDVIIMRRRMTLGNGITRLDCLHEDGSLRPYRFSASPKIYKYKNRQLECFFPKDILKKLHETGDISEESFLRFVFPVEFRLEGIELV